MSDKKQSRLLTRDVPGLVLFGLGSLFALTIVMWPEDGSLEGRIPGTEALFGGMIGAFGDWPSLFLSAGFAWIGASLFLREKPGSLPGRLSVLLATTLALSVGLGFFSEHHAGGFGTSVANALLGPAGLTAALALALIVAGAMVWIVRGPRSASNSQKPDESRAVPAALRGTEWEGVSAQEAEALVPEAPESAPGRRATAAAQAWSQEARDIRLRGGVPEGARPIPVAHDPAQQEGPAARADLQQPHAQTEGDAEQRSGEDLASASATEEPARAESREAGRATEVVAEVANEPTSATGAPVEARRPRPSWEQEEEPEAESGEAPGEEPEPEHDAELVAAVEPDADPAPESAGRQAPAWEQSSLFGDAAGSDVDRPRPTKLAIPDWLKNEDGVSVIGAEPAADAEAREVAEPEPEPEEDPAEEPDEEELAPETAAELDDEEELEDDEEEDEEDVEEDVEYEYVWVDENGDEIVDGPESEDEEEEDEELVAEDEEWEEEEEDEEDEEDEEEPEEEPGVAVAEITPAPPSEPAPKPKARGGSKAKSARKSPKKAPAKKASAKKAAKAEKKAAAKPNAAKPNAAKSGSSKAEAPAPEPGSVEIDEQLVFDAGCLILDRERVAVSLLEREFSIDFQQATALLDALQDEGLIGPYMGGTTRDILMSSEEWQERAPVR